MEEKGNYEENNVYSKNYIKYATKGITMIKQCPIQ